MREWNSPYNPFNSLKVLAWREHLEACARGEYLVPVTVAIDPTSACNLNCTWCNAFDVRQKVHSMTADNMIALADFLKEWGVKGNCIAGGGEPTLNGNLPVLIERCYKNGISNSLITNGTYRNGDLNRIMAEMCTWVGFSVDAGSPQSWKHLKGAKHDNIMDVIGNITALRKEVDRIGSKCTIGYKFLIHPDNAHEIVQATELARHCGAHYIQIRPVGWDNLTATKDKGKLSYSGMMDEIEAQLDEAMNYETTKFKVYTVRHKFTDGLQKKVNFKKCYAISIHPTFGADGRVHLCFDRRGDESLILCDYLPDPSNVLKFWNGYKHKKIMADIDVQKCPRCTIGSYNEIVEEVFLKDGMNLWHV